MEKFTDGLATVAEKVDDNKYLSSLKNAFTFYLPFILVGSFATLLTTLISSPQTGLAKWVPWLAKLGPAFSGINFATMSFMTIPIVFILGMQFAKRNKTPELATGALSVVAYITVVPQVVTGLVQNADPVTTPGLAVGALGAQGLFVGVLWTIVITELFRFLAKVKWLQIKMPPSVPPAVTQSFNSLLPIFIILVFSSVFGVLFKLATGSYLNEFIYKALQAPLEVLFQTSAGVVLMVIVAQLFWFLGIHGGLVVSPIRNPLFASAIAANVAAANAGEQPTQILTYGFWQAFAVLGGAGCTLSLIFAALLVSKQDDLKAISKIGFLPGICGISEPMVFGVPLLLNPIYAIPFIGNAAVASGIGVAAIKLGFIHANTVDVPFGVPIFLNGFISLPRRISLGRSQRRQPV
ncbi:PTS transporter subunit EIIC [Luteococcus sp. H138]|uniref:PTS sugar transporter subunit IIC n=1 Tax=unclassified Luteococcus TaxID=2639923 RepID=UPI00313DCBD4